MNLLNNCENCGTARIADEDICEHCGTSLVENYQSDLEEEMVESYE